MSTKRGASRDGTTRELEQAGSARESIRQSTPENDERPDVESLAAEIAARLAATALTPAGQLRVLAKVLVETGYRFATPVTLKERRALGECVADLNDIPIPVAMILQDHLLEAWLQGKKERGADRRVGRRVSGVQQPLC